MAPHVFDEALALQVQADGSYVGSTHAAWWNMVGPFGGISAATVVHAMQQHPQCVGAPAALTVNYVAPLTAGAFRLVLGIARTNRSSQHWTLEVTQTQADGSSVPVITGTALSAMRRDTFNGVDVDFAHAAPPHSLPRWDASAAHMEWLHRYEIRVVQGGVPDFGAARAAAPATPATTATAQSLTRQWVRHDPPRAMDYPALAAMADVFYPRVWAKRPQYVAAGTVSMTVYFHADAADLTALGDGFVLCEAQGQAFRNGHADQSARLWSPSGTLLATSHQLVYYKE